MAGGACQPGGGLGGLGGRGDGGGLGIGGGELYSGIGATAQYMGYH